MVRLTGPEASTVARRVLRPWRDEARVVWLAAVHHPETGELIDHGIAVHYQAPSSYTGEDVTEITVHGGQLVATLVLSAFMAAGAREALPGEFTRRAVLNGRMDLLQAEAVSDLIDAGTVAMHRVALRQLDGTLSRRLSELRDAILDLEAMIAYDIDFPEEDEGPIARERVHDATARVLDALDALLATAHTGEVIREGAVVVIAGPPNAGKSSLFNALVGSARAIVTEIPGTTRDALEALVDVEGWPVRLVDTAGLREAADPVEKLGIEVSERWLSGADLVLCCAERSDELALTVEAVRSRTDAPVIGVLTKADLHQPAKVEADAPADPHLSQIVAVSCVTSQGIPALASGIAHELERANIDPAGDVPLLMRERHRLAVESARSEVARFRQILGGTSVPSLIAAVHLRAAAAHLEDLIGAVDVEDVLDRVFATFCVGK